MTRSHSLGLAGLCCGVSLLVVERLFAYRGWTGVIHRKARTVDPVGPAA